MANVFEPQFDEPRDQPGFQTRRARVGRQIGAERLGVSLWEVDPGEAAYPYHLHLGEEELVVVLAGRPSLRSPSGWRELDEGEIVSFPRGEAGAHQIVNRTAEPARFLAISTNREPDIVLYPDSGKVGVAQRTPGGLHLFFRQSDVVDYHDGEQPPPS